MSEEKRDSLIIYRSFYEAIRELPKENQAEVWQAIFEYGLNFQEIDLKGLSKTIFTLVKPQIEANIKRYFNGKEPKTKQEASKPKAKPKQKASKPEANVYVNVNDNEDANGNEQNPIVLFEEFRVKYPGTKRGHEVELKTFQKHKDWEAVALLLLDRLDAEISDKKEKQKRNQFVAPWPMLSTYLTQRRWEVYEPANTPTPTADYKIDLSIRYESAKESGMRQIEMMCYTIGYQNCNRRELEWAYDFQRPYGFVSDPYKPNELLIDRGLPGTELNPNTLEQVLANG